MLSHCINPRDVFVELRDNWRDHRVAPNHTWSTRPQWHKKLGILTLYYEQKFSLVCDTPRQHLRMKCDTIPGHIHLCPGAWFIATLTLLSEKSFPIKQTWSQSWQQLAVNCAGLLDSHQARVFNLETNGWKTGEVTHLGEHLPKHDTRNKMTRMKSSRGKNPKVFLILNENTEAGEMGQ